MQSDLNDSRVIVTGGSRGIGRAIALAFAALQTRFERPNQVQVDAVAMCGISAMGAGARYVPGACAVTAVQV